MSAPRPLRAGRPMEHRAARKVPAEPHQRAARRHLARLALPEPEPWARPHHPLAVVRVKQHRRVERLRPVLHRGVVVRVRDGHGREPAQRGHDLARGLVEERHAVPEQVAPGRADQERALADGEARGGLDREQVRLGAAPTVGVARGQLREVGPALPAGGHVLPRVLADGAARRRLGRGRIRRPARGADRNAVDLAHPHDPPASEPSSARPTVDGAHRLVNHDVPGTSGGRAQRAGDPRGPRGPRHEASARTPAWRRAPTERLRPARGAFEGRTGRFGPGGVATSPGGAQGLKPSAPRGPLPWRPGPACSRRRQRVTRPRDPTGAPGSAGPASSRRGHRRPCPEAVATCPPHLPRPRPASRAAGSARRSWWAPAPRPSRWRRSASSAWRTLGWSRT